MDFQGVKPTAVRYEMRNVSGVDPYAQEQSKPGAFGRFLSGMGRFAGAVALPLSVLFPPAAIGAAGMYGLAGVGDLSQQNAYQKMLEQQSKVRTQQLYFPGLDLQGAPEAAPVSGPASGDYILSSLDNQIIDTMVAKNFSLQENAQMIGKG